MILALDPSRILGWARAEPGGELAYGHIRLAPDRAAPGVVGCALKGFLSETIMAVGPDLLVYEQPFMSKNAKTAFSLFGMAYLIDTIATEFGIEPWSVMIGEASKGLTGRAKFPGATYEKRREAKKQAAIAACWARGWNVATGDEADAIAVLLLAEAKRFPEAALSRPRVLKRPTGPLFTGVVP